MKTFTFKSVKESLASLPTPMSIKKTSAGDYKVSVKGDTNPDHGYFTNDLEDAFQTGHLNGKLNTPRVKTLTLEIASDSLEHVKGSVLIKRNGKVIREIFPEGLKNPVYFATSVLEDLRK